MNCFPCFGQRSKRNRGSESPPSQQDDGSSPPDNVNRSSVADAKDNPGNNGNVAEKAFTFRELAAATKNFRQECLVGEGGFGRVFKGLLQGSGQVVAVKQLDRNGMQGNKEFLSEVLSLGLLRHPNLVNLIGYCADGDQRLLVYEFMSGGSLDNNLLDNAPDKKPLDWFSRMQIAYGTAQGLEYLHQQANPIIYRDLKPSNILLDEELNPKLSDYGLSKLGPSADNRFHVHSMGTYGYSAPEYTTSGEVTEKSDVYSFGVVLLELITGRRVVDTTRPTEEQNLVSWAQPIFKEPKRFPDMADPLLEKQFPEKDLNQVVAIAAMCLQEEPTVRPLISDVVVTLSFIRKTPIASSGQVQGESIPISYPPPVPSNENFTNDGENSIAHQNGDIESSDSESSDHDDSSSTKLLNGDTSSHMDRYDSKSMSQEHESEYSEDSSESEDCASEYEEGSENEYQETAENSKRWPSKSSRKSSRKSRSSNESSRHRSSMRSPLESDSSRSQGTSRSSNHQSRREPGSTKLKDDGMSLDHTSSRSSRDESSSPSKSSNGSSAGSRRYQEGCFSSGHKSSKKSRDGSISPRKSSKGSFDGSRKYQDGSFSLSQKSSGKSRDGSISQSSKGSFDGSRRYQEVSSSVGHDSSRKLCDGSISHSNSSMGSFGGSGKFQEETFSLGDDSLRLSHNERVLSYQQSSQTSHAGSVSLDHSDSKGSEDSRGSKDGSVFLDYNSSRGSKDGSVTLDHIDSRGSENGSVHSS